MISLCCNATMNSRWWNTFTRRRERKQAHELLLPEMRDAIPMNMIALVVVKEGVPMRTRLPMHTHDAQLSCIVVYAVYAMIVGKNCHISASIYVHIYVYIHARASRLSENVQVHVKATNLHILMRKCITVRKVCLKHISHAFMSMHTIGAAFACMCHVLSASKYMTVIMYEW